MLKNKKKIQPSIKMSVSEIMHLRHFNGCGGNGGIFFNMREFYKTTDERGRTLPVDQWKLIEVVNEE